MRYVPLCIYAEAAGRLLELSSSSVPDPVASTADKRLDADDARVSGARDSRSGSRALCVESTRHGVLPFSGKCVAFSASPDTGEGPYGGVSPC